MFRIALCDDEPRQTDYLFDAITQCFSKLDLEYVIDTYDNGEKLVQAIQEFGEHYQILLLDIEMSGLNGIETAKAIRLFDSDMIIVYVTNYDQYTLDSFKVAPFRYLMKPVTTRGIAELMEAVLEEITKKRSFFFFAIGKERYQIRSDHIICFMSILGRKIHITLDSGLTYDFYGKIRDTKGYLDPMSFVQINSGTIINLRFIDFIDSKGTIHLSQNLLASVSRSRTKLFKQQYYNFVEKSLL